MPKTPAELMMERETRVTYGAVPKHLSDAALAEMRWQIRQDEFLLRAVGDHYLHYRRGHGITIWRGEGADLSEESLWLNGTLYAAIASLNGLLPIHASAVAAGGSVFAFTGPAGSGKSTLIAALGARGFPMFCDDTMVLDLSDPDQIVCLPGHKRLKLTPDALALTGAAPQEKVSLTIDKFYARPAAGDVGESMPLAELTYLDEEPEPAIHPMSGAERFMRLQDDHYTTDLYSGARAFDRAGHFAHLTRLARELTMSRFARPRNRSRFDEGVELVADYIRGGGSSGISG
jgi:hypothetical protein